MTTFNVTGATAGVNFGGFNIDNWDTAVVVSQTGTLWSITPSGQPTWNFTGVFSGYDANGFPTGGTITSISVNTGAGTLNFNLTATPVDVSAVLAAIAADDESALFGAIFAGNDVITGTAFTDYLYGYGGHDNMRGGLGADYLTGGDGDDIIAGGTNTNTNFGNGDGADTINGDAGNDVLRGGDGDDSLYGGIDNDNLRGDAGNDILDGGSGIDFVSWRFDQAAAYLGAGVGVTFSAASLVIGGTTVMSDGLGGTDTLYSIERAIITGTDFNDVLTGSAGDDQLTGYNGNNTLDGGAGADNLFDNAGNSTLLGGTGDDRITLYDNSHTFVYVPGGPYYSVGESHDVVDGGAGVDTVFIRWSAYNDSAVTVVMSGDVLTASTADGLLTMSGVSIERVEASGGDGNDVMTGGAGNDEFFGNFGVDTLTGGAGDDLLSGGAGDDILNGGLGNDRYEIFISGDVSLANVVDASAFDVSGTTHTVADGNGYTDTITSIEGVLIQAGGGNDTITGSAGHDTLSGGSGADTINGGDGDDIIIQFVANAGSLTTDGNDTIDGGAGIDTLSFDGVASNMTVNLATGLATGLGNGTDTLSNIENVIGGQGADIITGNAAANRLVGGAGADQLDGGDGDDVLIGGDGGDTLNGGEGNDRIQGGPGLDTLTGGNGVDTLVYDFSDAGLATGASLNLDFANTTSTFTVINALGNDTVSGFEQGDVTGTQFNDNFTGGSGADIIRGLAGNDTINGRAGADDLQGGDGDDSINGGLNSGTNLAYVDGADLIDGAAGNDTLRGGNGDDTLLGGVGVDNLRGDAGNDILNGGAGLDMAAYRFDDIGAVTGVTFSAATFNGALTVVIADGLGGTDTLISIERAVITGTEFNDFLTGSSGDDQLTGYNGNNTLNGGAGADTIFDNAGGNSVISGGTGDDRIVLYDNSHTTFTLGTGNDTVDGGAGFDTVVISWEFYTTSAMNVVLSGDVLTASSAAGMTVSGVSIESIQVFGGSADDVMTGGANNDELYGRAGNDTLNGGDGDDGLSGGLGNDTLNGGAGNDRYQIFIAGDLNLANVVDMSAFDVSGATQVISDGQGGFDTISSIEGVFVSAGGGDDIITGSAGHDVLVGGLGADTINAGNGNDLIVQNNSGQAEGNDTIDGGAGIDTIEFKVDRELIINLATGLASGDAIGTDTITNIENVIGGSQADTITGSTADNRLEGRSGNDVISAGNGNDVIIGGEGNDTLNGGDGADVLTGRDGDDVMNGGNGDDRLNGGLGADAFNGGAGTDTADYRAATASVGLNLNTGANAGEGAGDTFSSIERWLMSNFDDSFFGTASAEQVDGYDGADVLNGGGGIDSLRGLNGNDTLNGDDGNDTLQGGANDDILNGGNGFDKLYGDAGNDTLTGGLDSTDQFIWSGNTNLGSDHITDFQDGIDKIRLVGTGATQFSDLVIGTNGSGWATITLANGTVITLDGVLAASVDATDFLWI